MLNGDLFVRENSPNQTPMQSCQMRRVFLKDIESSRQRLQYNCLKLGTARNKIQGRVTPDFWDCLRYSYPLSPLPHFGGPLAKSYLTPHSYFCEGGGILPWFLHPCVLIPFYYCNLNVLSCNHFLDYFGIFYGHS